MSTMTEDEIRQLLRENRRLVEENKELRELVWPGLVDYFLNGEAKPKIPRGTVILSGDGYQQVYSGTKFEQVDED